MNHCLFIKESFTSRYILCTVSFLRTWMLGISLFSTYAFKRLGKMLFLEQFREIASYYSFTQCCAWQTWSWSHILSFYVISVFFLGDCHWYSFLKLPSKLLLVFPFLELMSQQFQGKYIKLCFSISLESDSLYYYYKYMFFSSQYPFLSSFLREKSVLLILFFILIFFLIFYL